MSILRRAVSGRLVFLLAVLIAEFVLFSASSYAQQTKSLEIVIEELSDGAKKCGVTNATLTAPAILTLRNNRLQESATATDPFLYINATITFIEQVNACAYGITVSIRTYAVATPHHGFTASSPETVLLCDAGTIVTDARGRIPAIIAGDVEQLVKQCLSKVLY